MEGNLSNSTIDNSTELDVDGEISLLLYFSSVFNVVCFVLNVFVIFAVTRRDVIPGRIPLAFLVNQLVSDALSCLVRSFTWATDRDWVLPDNDWSTVFCKLFSGGLLYWTTVSTASNNLTLLTIERYISVAHPTHHRKFTPAVIAFLIFLSYTLGVVQNLPTLPLPARYGHHCGQASSSGVWVSVLVTMQLVLSVIAPLITIIYCNTRIIFILKHQTQRLRRPNGSTAVVNPSAALHTRLQRELSIAVCILGGVYLVTNGPTFTAYALGIYGAVYVDYYSWYYEIIMFVQNCFFLVNPLVCLLQMRAVRNRTRKLLSSCFPRRNTAPEINTLDGVSSSMAQLNKSALTLTTTTATTTTATTSAFSEIQPSDQLSRSGTSVMPYNLD